MSSGPIVLEGAGQLAAAIAQQFEDAGVQVERVALTELSRAAAQAQLERARVLVLASDDDPGNVERALWARRLRPELPLVVRLFDDGLAGYLAGKVERLTILSMSQIAAPAFAEAALAANTVSPPPARLHLRLRRFGRPDRVLVGAVLGLLLVVLPSTAFFARVLHLSTVDALYFVWTTVMTVGYGDISLAGASAGVKIVGMLLMLAGAAFVATLFAFLTGWLVTRRLEVLRGRVRVHGEGHMVIAGAGNLGYRVANLVGARGRRVVVIERDDDNDLVTSLRTSGHHVISADATSEEILDLAGVDRAGAVLALTDSDVVNLRIALHLRARGLPAPVVMRIVSSELSAHVTQRGDGIALSPIFVAAKAFVEAACASKPE